MSSTFSLAASVRTIKGKGAARKLRAAKNVPAVFYGPKVAPAMLVVERRELERLLQQSGAENMLLSLEISGGAGAVTRRSAMLKDLQVDPLKNRVLHADFYEIAMDREITVSIPVVLTGTPAGQDDGGVLQHVRRELTVSCLPGALVESLEVDVSGLNVGDAVHISDIELPQGINVIDDADLTVATLAPPQAEEAVAEELEEAEQPEELTEEES